MDRVVLNKQGDACQKEEESVIVLAWMEYDKLVFLHGNLLPT